MKKWIFRLLLVVVTVIAFGLFALNILSGTGDTQKRGLEQAFSGIFQGNTKFGTLKTFNLFPHLTIAVSNLEINRTTGEKIVAEDVDIGFGLSDVLFKTRKIEKFTLKNVHVDQGIYLPLNLFIEGATLSKDNKSGKGQFAFHGQYGSSPLQGQFDMVATGGNVPNYAFVEDNPFTMTLGSVMVSGVFSPYVATGGTVKNIALSAATKTGKKSCSSSDKVIASSAFFHDILADLSKIKTPDDFHAVCEMLVK